MALLNIIKCEFLKLKRSKIMLLSMIGTQAVPAMLLIEAIQQHMKHPEQILTLEKIFDNSLVYVMLLMNFMIFVTILAYQFSREYTEKTLKNLIPLPISRAKFVTGKYMILLILIIILTFVTWVGILAAAFFYHTIFGLESFSCGIVFKWLLKFIEGAILMFFTISPFAYAAEKTKGLVIPMIASAVIVMGSAALSNQDMGALYPWTAAYLLIKGRLVYTGYPVSLSIAIIILVSVIGFYMTYHYFQKEDLK